MALNVNRNVQDAFYRYKMPRLQAKVEGKGNGIKTVVVNMVDIARALDRPPTYVTKYFGCELGAQTQFDIKAERYIVNGCHDAGKMQDMLDGFIKKFVLCEKCDNPETVLKVKKNMIGASCKACGHIYTMDMRHKLTTFIVKNPPEKDIDSQGSSQTEKKDRKKEKEEKKKGDKKNGSDENNDDDDWGEDGDDGVWISDTSAEAIAKRAQEQLTSGISGLVIDSDMEKTEEERINIFFKFVQVKRGMINSAAAKEILAEAERLEIKNKAPVVLCELLFNDKMFKEKQIAKYAKLLLRFTHENPKGQKYLIGGIEKTVESFEATLLPKVAHIFKELFEEDVLEEEVIFEWAKKVSKKNVSKELAQKIHDKAAPFVKWLQEAEEETSDDDSDGVEIEYDERAKISKLKEADTSEPGNDVNENQKKEQSDGEEGPDDDDIDIDNL
jgi:translation initiation factor 5